MSDDAASRGGSALTEGLGLVERLRLLARTVLRAVGRPGNVEKTVSEAADEIERLRATIAECGLALQRARVQQEAAVAAERERCVKLCDRAWQDFAPGETGAAFGHGFRSACVLLKKAFERKA